MVSKKNYCKWTPDYDEYAGFHYSLTCDEERMLSRNNETRKFKYCPYCGKEIELLDE